MTLATIRKRIAENLGILTSDESTIATSKVTSTGIDNHINDIYREELFQLLSEHFPDDFKQFTYRANTYTATGTASSSSTSTTLIATTGIFTNAMEGFYVYNFTDDESAKIITYTSTTQVTLDTTIGDTWDGDTIYVLGNEFSFGGDSTDIKEVLAARIKFTSSAQFFIPCKVVEKNHKIQYGDETFSTAQPYYYLTTANISGVSAKAIGFLPFPTNYNGTFEVDYIGRPPAISATDEPVLTVLGIADAIVKGTTAWGFRQMGLHGDADRWELLYKDAKQNMLMNYRPKNREEAYTLEMSEWASSVMLGNT